MGLDAIAWKVLLVGLWWPIVHGYPRVGGGMRYISESWQTLEKRLYAIVLITAIGTL